jgi:F-box domain
MRLSRMPQDILAEISRHLPVHSQVSLRFTCWDVYEVMPRPKSNRTDRQLAATAAMRGSPQFLTWAISAGLVRSVDHTTSEAACVRDDCLGIEHLRASYGHINYTPSHASYVVKCRLFLWGDIRPESLFIDALGHNDVVMVRSVFTTAPSSHLACLAIIHGDEDLARELLLELPAELWERRIFQTARRHRARYVLDVAARLGVRSA